MQKRILEKHINIYDNWISINGVGRIGLYSPMDRAILLDYSMLFIVGTNENIPCENDHSKIKQKILNLFEAKT